MLQLQLVIASDTASSAHVVLHLDLHFGIAAGSRKHTEENLPCQSDA